MLPKKKRYELYVLKQSLTRATVGSDEVAWRGTALAYSRSEAVQECWLPIRSLKWAARDAGYRYLSVYCGTDSPTSRAARLDPIRLEV